jgi:HK97 family phage prohead protease
MSRYNHEALLGTTAAGSLRLSIDATGLDYETDMLTDSVSERVFQLVTRGDVSQSSFAFYVMPSGDDWSLTEAGFPQRTLLAGQLVDVAPVDQPAYLDTSTGLRSLAEKRGVELAEVEELARGNKLAALLTKPPTVIDLGARSTEPQEQGETHSSARVQLLRRALEMKKPN